VTISPPYPADVRTKGWRFEVDLERIRESDTWTLAPPDLRPWLLMLWSTAWVQTPAGAFPNEDAMIAARIGMDLRAFKAARPILMRRWELASDGRFYHPVITERVLALLALRQAQADRKAASRAKNAKVTEESHGTDTDVTEESRVTDNREGKGREGKGFGEGTGREGKGTVPLFGHTPNSESTPSPSAPAATKPRPAKKCPVSFVVDAALRQWVKREAPSVKVGRETAKFRDHTFARAISDWPGAWRNWMREAEDRAHRSGNGAKSFAERSSEHAAAEVRSWTGGAGLSAMPSKQDEIINPTETTHGTIEHDDH
jgi:hypothetical protein